MLEKIKIIIVVFFIVNMIFFAIVNTSNASTIDDVISDANGFIDEGKENYQIDDNELRETLFFLYNLLLGIGIIAAVIVGSILGIKYIVGSVEEKAEYKQTLWAYLISCIVIFGAFGIWKIVVEILLGMGL